MQGRVERVDLDRSKGSDFGGRPSGLIRILDLHNVVSLDRTKGKRLVVDIHSLRIWIQLNNKVLGIERIFDLSKKFVDPFC